MSSPTPMNVMVVPARGGMGRAVETQANTLAAEIARKIGGHHRLMHLPDHMDAAAMQEMCKLPEIRKRWSCSSVRTCCCTGLAVRTIWPVTVRCPCPSSGSCWIRARWREALGYYFSAAGECIYAASSVGVDSGTAVAHMPDGGGGGRPPQRQAIWRCSKVQARMLSHRRGRGAGNAAPDGERSLMIARPSGVSCAGAFCNRFYKNVG